jgi:glutamine amidotransferase
MNTVAVIDYGLCNLDSVARAVAECGGKPIVTNEPEALTGVDRLVLPGVGAFHDAMDNLRRTGLDEAIKIQTGAGIPLLAVCLGMQLLARSSTEGGKTEGLGLVDAEVRRLSPDDETERVPHMGWNNVDVQIDHAIFREVPTNSDFYFVHSYHLVPSNEADVSATTPYCGGFVSGIAKGNLIGFQFHPEKSQRWGLQLIANFLAL